MVKDRTRFPTKKGRIKAVLTGVVPGLLFSMSATADDISVYSSVPKKPKILLTLDYSKSMNSKVDGTNLRRIDVLRDTVLQLLETYKLQVEFGLGPMFAVTGGGVRWPISDLSQDASLIDPSIPPGSGTGLDVVSALVENTPLLWGTATTAALAESALYFAGGPVHNGGVDSPNTYLYKPLQWDAGLNAFDDYTPIRGSAAAYEPANAFSEGAATGSVGYCRRAVTPISGQLIPNDCKLLPATYTVTNCVNAPTSGYNNGVYDYGVARDRGLLRSGYEVCEYVHADSWAGATYKSPITNQCQANTIILISDGDPVNTINEPMIQETIGAGFQSCEDLSSDVFNNAARVAGNCATDIADHLAYVDQVEGIEGSTVTTHTIGFGIGSVGAEYLNRIAEVHPDANSLLATNADELFAALDGLISGALPDSQQFSNFSVEVDRTSFSHDNRAYVPLFRPSDAPSWQGNLKGYFIGEDGLEDVDGNPAVETVDSIVRFTENARSFWSDTADGNSVLIGGASGELDPARRKLYTYLDNQVPAQGVRLHTQASFRLDNTHPDLEPQFLGDPARVDAPALLDWIREQPLGEPLHSNTVISDYAGDRRVVYVMTNQGFIHGIDASTPVNRGDNTGGEELFAFMPFSLLDNIEFMKNGGFQGEHIYGLDGSITEWHEDINGDGIVNGNDTLMLVFGMRRGGNSYYALDVTIPERPELKWQINGGTPGFEKLAQTWSKPSLITVKKGNTTDRVLAFGGGYDDSVDDSHVPVASSGNSVFIVDRDGDLIWSANHPDMDFGIPSDLRVIDSNADAIADRIYVGDLGGQVWRIDFDDVSTNNSFEVTKFANFYSDTDYKPFFYPPSVSRDQFSEDLLIAIGSGNRDNPVRDRSNGSVYVLQDNNPAKGAPDGNFETVRLRDLVDATNVAQASHDDLADKKGWFVTLGRGEKALSPLVAINGDLLFTTYQATVDQEYDVCGVPPAEQRLYGLNINNAGAPNAINADEFNTLPASRYIDLDMAGIPPEPLILFPKEGDNLDVFVGNEKQIELSTELSTVFWYEK